MSDDIITMEDMAQVYEVTDALRVDREHLRVELAKVDPGAFAVTPAGLVEVTLPLTTPLGAWLPRLREGLERMLRPA